MGTLTLKRFNGIEQFRLVNSNVFAVRNDDGTIMLWFETETDPAAIMSVEDTAELSMNPDAEITLILEHLALKEFKAMSYELINGYNPKTRSLDARLYYFEHEAVNENTVELEYRDKGVFYLKWAGRTTDISYYDGSKPDTILEVEGEFILKDYEKWN
ncbi:hypothetical protein [Paenibacillus hubeiensis]|uniref:hypothetical protein n=1 Tax=Paenibacillus hubeiensis TaxID=3077330 RepID=UPI0031BAC260